MCFKVKIANNDALSEVFLWKYLVERFWGLQAARGKKIFVLNAAYIYIAPWQKQYIMWENINV